MDLLKKIDPERDAIEGTWRPTGDVLAFDGDHEWSRLQIPDRPPEEYDLTVVAERLRGTEILVIGLVVGGRQGMVLLDGWGGGVSGLEKIDGRASNQNETTNRRWRFVNGRPTTIVCKVRKTSVTVACDGEILVDWTGDSGRLSLVNGWKIPDDRRLFLGGWKGSPFRIHRIEFKAPSGNE